jgi:hypothetical protein
VGVLLEDPISKVSLGSGARPEAVTGAPRGQKSRAAPSDLGTVTKLRYPFTRSLVGGIPSLAYRRAVGRRTLKEGPKLPVSVPLQGPRSHPVQLAELLPTLTHMLTHM